MQRFETIMSNIKCTRDTEDTRSITVYNAFI